MHPNDTAISDYVDGTIEPAERTSVEQHLATCAACRRLADDLREIARATATLESREPPVRAWGRIERAIAKLPEGCREAFVLHDVEGFDHKEVGNLLGIAEGTSKSQVFKARLKLRGILRGDS